jgi:hypothetical protein
MGPADPPTLSSAVPLWNCGGVIPLGWNRSLRVIGTRLDQGPDDDPVLVIESA